MEERVSTLEAQLRQLRRAVSLLALLLLFLIILILVRGPGKQAELSELQLQSLDIVNDSGHVVVHLGVRSSGAGGIWVADEAGEKLLKLNQDEAGGVITILASGGSEAQIIAVQEHREGNSNGNQ